MTSNKNPQEQFCQVCGEPLTYVPHYEYDGVTENGSFEPYYECVNGCAYPEVRDEDLTAEELLERGKVDTQTQYGIVELSVFTKGAIVL